MASVSGEIYVEVEAKTVTYGASLLDVDVSGNDSGGDEGGQSGTYWLVWDYHIENNQYVGGGYRNSDWYWDDADNYLAEGWSKLLASGEIGVYTDDYTGFTEYLAAVQPANLNNILGDWPNDGSKGRLAKKLVSAGLIGCVDMF